MEPLHEAFGDPHPRVRLAAAQALSMVAREVPGAVDLLRDALRDQDPRVRLTVGQALLSFGKEASGAVAALHESLQDQDPEVRLVAAQALWRIEGKGEPILPVLVEAITSANSLANLHPILTILHDLGPDAPGNPAIAGNTCR